MKIWIPSGLNRRNQILPCQRQSISLALNQRATVICSSDCEGDNAIKTEEDLADEPDSKRRLSENTMLYSSRVLKTFQEPRIVVQAASDVGHLAMYVMATGGVNMGIKQSREILILGDADEIKEEEEEEDAKKGEIEPKEAKEVL